MQKECRCHGVSGSCELQICRLRPRTFAEISEELFTTMYQRARFVQSIRDIETDDQHLLYGRKSINYCRPNTFIDYAGVQAGRECFSVDGCERACCQRGYRIRSETKRIENCQCFFSWSIVNIQCTPCEKRITRMICV
jgi:hypothetical protein